jgi:hypothetical protein
MSSRKNAPGDCRASAPRKDSAGKRPPNTEAQIVVPTDGGVRDAEGRVSGLVSRGGSRSVRRPFLAADVIQVTDYGWDLRY